MTHLVEAPLVGRRPVARGMWVLAFAAQAVAAEARAGQFVNLGLPAGPLLRRPFSVYRAVEGAVEIVLRAVGGGTEHLLALAEGEVVSCLGPLGRGFEFDPSWGRVALVSGGLGVAPMRLAARDAWAAGLKVAWVHGARTAADLCREADGDEVVWVTDDGSRGRQGSAVDALTGAGSGAVLACGPNQMLSALARQWPDAQVAVETYMGCGTGVCLGCAVPLAAGGYDRACTEGPVYRASDVDWERLPSHLHYRPEPSSPSPAEGLGGESHSQEATAVLPS